VNRSVILSIGGFDPTCLAGIITDAITFRNLGARFITLISALTSQNSKGLSTIEITSDKLFKNQFSKLLEDFSPDVIKIGMLPSKYQIDLISEYIRENSIKLVLDPVKTASAGGDLVQDEVYHHLIKKLFPLSYVVTPNIPEAELITSRKIHDETDMIDAAKTIKNKDPYSVYLKGGHLIGKPIDVLSFENKISKFESERQSNINIRGTGCKFASSVASYLFMGDDVLTACSNAKNYIDNVILNPGKYY
jgi:hydroxymethylpyrimidine/phosphomethylpyrimidine kinase